MGSSTTVIHVGRSATLAFSVVSVEPPDAVPEKTQLPNPL
jgi:hypothetical protein